MHEDELPRVLMQVLDSFTDDLRKLHGLLVDVIDFQESKRQRRLVVLEGIDLDLDKEKRAYEGLGDFLEVLQVRAQNTRRIQETSAILQGCSHFSYRCHLETQIEIRLQTFVYTSIYSYIQYHRMSPDRSWTIWERTMMT